MMGRGPTYPLWKIKQCGADAIFTRKSLRDGHALGFSRGEMVEVVRSLKVEQFYKTMPAKKRPGLWQDVYRVLAKEVKLYLKLQITGEGKIIIISFKNLL